MRYAADPQAARLLAALAPLIAVFHRPSGVTHLLASPAPELLDALAAGPGSPDDVLARLADRFDLADGDAAVVAARLEELVTTGLAWRM